MAKFKPGDISLGNMIKDPSFLSRGVDIRQTFSGEILTGMGNWTNIGRVVEIHTGVDTQDRFFISGLKIAFPHGETTYSGKEIDKLELVYSDNQ